MEAVVVIVVVLIFLALIGLCFYFGFRGLARNHSQAQQKKAEAERLGAEFFGTLRHVSGLPVAKGVPVTVFYGEKKIVFLKDNQEISVAREKIAAIDLSSGQNLRTQQMAGAVFGTVVFGGIGGAVLGMLVSSTFYLVISYVSNSQGKYIVLDSSENRTFSRKVVNDFRKTQKSSAVSIEL